MEETFVSQWYLLSAPLKGIGWKGRGGGEEEERETGEGGGPLVSQDRIALFEFIIHPYRCRWDSLGLILSPSRSVSH